jgi:hypothetical protein
MDYRAPAQLIYTDSAQWSIAMAFITDKEKLKSGLIIFRRGDVTHRTSIAASSSRKRIAIRPSR